MIIKNALFFIILLSVTAYGQLNVFDLQVAKTDETCLGNGTITFTTNNATPLANFLFTVYKLPNLNSPISVSASNVLGSLNAGTYKVLATQTLGNLTNADEEQIVIENAIVPLAYSINVSNQNCSQGAQITLNATSGSISECEIISGPQIRPLQSSTVFENLPAGPYNIRVFDECGEAVVTTYTVVLNNADLSISDATYSGSSVDDCDSVTIHNIVSAPEGSAISYPISVQYILHPPGAPDVIYNQEFSTGPANALELAQEIPFLDGAEYTYDVNVTDNCNVTFTNTGINVDPNPEVTLSEVIGQCGKYLQLNVTNFKAPLTVTFMNPPAGMNPPANFDPAVFNNAHPGPFTEGAIAYGGQTMPVPPGTYVVQVTDACGRIATGQRTFLEVLPEPSVVAKNNGCYALLGKITVSVSGRSIVSAVITSTDADYQPALPDDVSDAIIEGRLKLFNMPLGTYIIDIIDSCGLSYTVTALVPEFVESDFTATSVPYCTENLGSIQVTSGNGELASISIISAPAGFSDALPLDVSSGIAPSGILYLGDLPEGNYTLSGTDVCGIQRTVSVLVTGYAPDAEPFQFVPNCGSFDIVMSDNDTTSSETTYWMQKQHPLTGQWGHPANGSGYQAGDMPTADDSMPLSNNHTTFNLIYSGTFRIVKSFKSFASGIGEQYCLEAWEPFTYNMDLAIGNAYSMGCADSPNDVFIEAVNGLAPYTYEITEKDEQQFLVNNGNNPVFSDLEPAIYNFKITDACGSMRNLNININLLPSLVTANLADDLLICTDLGTETNHTFDLSTQDAVVLGDQHPDNYSVSYHISLSDADNNLNPLPSSYSNISNPQTIYARVVHNSIALCYDVISFDLHVNDTPEFETTNSYLCEGEPVIITAEAGFDAYEWSTGETTRSITVSEEGTYSVTVKRIIGNSYCPATASINVLPSGAATIVSIDTEDWTYDQNAIAVNVSGQGNYEYSLDGVTYQDSPRFDGLIIGNYTVYVRDKNGCGITSQEVLLLNYPNFFTPNGDGTHDTWRIKYAYMEPGMNIDIMDRFGKLIISLNPSGEGWDGTYNGAKLPSTDYWFVVTRANGQVHKGHFAMKR